MKRLRGGYLTCLLCAAGCASQPPAASHGQARAQSAAEEAAIVTALQQLDARRGDYKISPADLLEITIYQNGDLDRKIRVSQNGSVSFPLVGTVTLGGLSVIEAERTLSDKLRDFLVQPQVTVFIKEYGNKHVYVLGQVAKPGSYDLPTESPLSAVEAVSMAGGFTAIAAPDRTKVIRNASGKSETITVEVSAVTHRGQKDKDVLLQPGDVIFVPQSFF